MHNLLASQFSGGVLLGGSDGRETGNIRISEWGFSNPRRGDQRLCFALGSGIDGTGDAVERLAWGFCFSAFVWRSS